MGTDAAGAAFARAIAGRDHEVDLFGGAVAIARLGRDDVDAHALARELDLIAEAVRTRVGEGADADALAGAVAGELFAERGFRGNREQYGDPANSYLDRVVERRLGIPISLSLVYLEISGRVGLECDGIGFPGHFLVRCGGADGFYVDPFNGGERPDRAGLLERLRARPGESASPDVLLAAVTRRQILQRMLVNLKGALARRRQFAHAADACSYLLALAPWSFEEQRDRGLLRYEAGNPELALEDLAAYARNAPDARDVKHVAALVERIRSEAGA